MSSKCFTFSLSDELTVALERYLHDYSLSEQAFFEFIVSNYLTTYNRVLSGAVSGLTPDDRKEI